MTITTRVLRLFKADMNGILDCIEEPHAILKQAIRDMEIELDKLVKSMHLMDDSIKQLSVRYDGLVQVINESQVQIDQSFKAENDELARYFVKKKLDTEARRKRIRESIESVKQKKRVTEEKHSAFLHKLNEIKSKAEVFKDSVFQESRSHDGFSCGIGSPHGSQLGVGADTISASGCDVEIEFLQQKARWQHIDGLNGEGLKNDK